MVTSEKVRFTDDTKLADLTVGEFKIIIRAVVEDIVQQAVFQLEQQLPDPDAGKELRPEFAEQLQQALSEKGKLHSLEEVAHELGLDE